MKKTQQNKALKYMAFGLFFIAISVAGVIGWIFPVPQNCDCGLLDFWCYINLPSCLAQQATINAWVSMLSGLSTIGGIVLFVFGVYMFLR